MKKNVICCLALICAAVLIFGLNPVHAASYTKEKPLILRFNTVVKSEGAPGQQF